MSGGAPREAGAAGRGGRRAWRRLWPPLLLLGLVLLAWQLGARLSGLGAFLLPAPTDVASAAWRTRELLGGAVLTTLLETAIGLAIALLLAMAIAFGIESSDLLRRALYPILVASQTVQILAIAPLLIIWFGFGLAPKVMVVVLVCFFPLTISFADGLSSVEPSHVSILRSMGAGRLALWRTVRIPAALPSFFSGLKIAVTYSVVGATIGEWVGGSDGLGLYMLRSKNALATDQVFVGVMVTTLLSIGLFALVALAEHLAMPWRPRRTSDARA